VRLIMPIKVYKKRMQVSCILFFIILKRTYLQAAV
jgi:hypothetical protein